MSSFLSRWLSPGSKKISGEIMPTSLISYLRIASYTLLVIIIATLFQLWQKEHPITIKQTILQKSILHSNSNNLLPNSIHSPLPNSQTTSISPQSYSFIHVTTDLFQATIDPKGGNLIGLKLLKYPEKLNSQNPTTLLTNDEANKYITQSGLYGQNGPDTNTSEALFTPEKTNYVLNNTENTLEVRLHWHNSTGIDFTKIYTFSRDNYAIKMNYEINNTSKTIWQGHLYLQLLRKNTPPPTHHGLLGIGLSTFFGAAISSPDKLFQKISFNKMEQQPIDKIIQGGWIAMLQHYFLSAWVPDKQITAHYFSNVTSDGLYDIGIYQPEITVNPGEKITTGAQLYVGPESTDQLQKVSPSLKLTIDYGVLWMISAAIFWLMQKIYLLVHNWGWSIVIVTLLIKLAFYQLSAKSYRSMAGLKKIQPKLNELKEKYGEDRQKLTQETLALYKKEKVNPMGGCLPILIQIPVFIALYSVLVESVELRQAPFILWIHDLSTSDPYYILPILMGLSMFLQQRLNPPSPDPMQAKIMMVIPFLFIAMFAGFPAGLMLYWFVNNMLSFLQQWYIMRKTNQTK